MLRFLYSTGVEVKHVDHKFHPCDTCIAEVKCRLPGITSLLLVYFNIEELPFHTQSTGKQF